MRTFLLAATAVAVLIPASSADAKRRHRHYYRGERVCSHSGGTTGAIAGGVGGALVGQSIFGHGALGTIAGAAGGALGGRAIDRTITAKRRCYYR